MRSQENRVVVSGAARDIGRARSLACATGGAQAVGGATPGVTVPPFDARRFVTGRILASDSGLTI